jgi:hypothetical protein
MVLLADLAATFFPELVCGRLFSCVPTGIKSAFWAIFMMSTRERSHPPFNLDAPLSANSFSTDDRPLLRMPEFFQIPRIQMTENVRTAASVSPLPPCVRGDAPTV